MSTIIAHNKPSFSKEEENVVIKVLRSGFISQGREVESFENAFCKYMGLPEGHAVAVSSGTAALYMALHALDTKNKSVALPVYTCSTLRHAASMCGAIPHYFDTNSDDCNVDCKKINESDCDIAIVPHMYGFPQHIQKNPNLKIIEDCAQSIGATVNRQKVGLQGDIGVFSFYATKLMTSGGQGGMIVSKNKSLIDSIRDYRQFDCRNDKKNRFNFQMTDLQAAIGLVQLQRVDKFLEKREIVFQTYVDAGLDILYQNYDSSIQPVRFRALLNVKNQSKTIQTLKNYGIASIIPIEKWELLDDCVSYPNAEKWCGQLVSLPCYPDLTQNSIERITKTIKESGQ